MGDLEQTASAFESGEQDPRETPDSTLLSMEEFVGIWKRRKVLVLTSDGIRPVFYAKWLEKAFRKLMPMLPHMGFKHNVKGKKGRTELDRTHKMRLEIWKELYFFVMVGNTPEMSDDPIVVARAASALQKSQRAVAGKTSKLILPPGISGA